MSDLSPRRRMAGRALLGAGLLAIPLTASVSYAATEAATAAAAEAPQAPEPPAPPPPPPGGPEAPLPPPPPPPGVIMIDTRTGTVTGAGEGEGAGDAQVTEQVWRDADGKERRMKIVMRGGPGHAGAPEHRAQMQKHFEALRSDDKAEREAAIAALRAELDAGRARGDVMMFRRHLGEPGAGPMPPMPPMPPVMVMSGCTPGSSEMVETSEDKEGRQKVVICHKRIADASRAGMEEARAGLAEARAGLEEARAEIARDKDLSEATRQQVLRTLDNQIERLKRSGK